MHSIRSLVGRPTQPAPQGSVSSRPAVDVLSRDLRVLATKLNQQCGNSTLPIPLKDIKQFLDKLPCRQDLKSQSLEHTYGRTLSEEIQEQSALIRSAKLEIYNKSHTGILATWLGENLALAIV